MVNTHFALRVALAVARARASRPTAGRKPKADIQSNHGIKLDTSRVLQLAPSTVLGQVPWSCTVVRATALR